MAASRNTESLVHSSQDALGLALRACVRVGTSLNPQKGADPRSMLRFVWRVWVRICPWNLSAELHQGKFGTRFTARPTALRKTKGRKRANRSHLFRVNIERGWVVDDEYVGGAY